MRRALGFIALSASMVCVAWPSATLAQHHPPPPPHGGAHRGHVVFVGGYFYDPFWGPYPWWPHPAYPYPYFPVYDNRAVLRVLATPKNAGVYVDGFYAGVVDDFNGYFEGLPLPPGGHEVVLYLDGYRTTSRRIYLGPGSTFKLQETMERMPIGETSEAPILAPPLPPPPNGSSLPPRTASGAASSTASPAPPGHDVAILMLRVQPADAQVRIDGEPWASSDGGHFQIQLPAGRHRIEVTDSGYRGYSGDVDLVAGETVPLNVSLVRGGSD